ncbi:hypothetical protein D3C75_1250810 [compost metagenome]
MKHSFGQLQQYLPGSGAGDRGERAADAQQALRHVVVQESAQLAGVAAVPGQQAGSADDAHLALAIEQLLAAVQAQLLQVV